jgi:hypothetical protein
MLNYIKTAPQNREYPKQSQNEPEMGTKSDKATGEWKVIKRDKKG